MLDKAEIFLSLGCNTMLVDFMGSGRSEGDQTTIGYFEAEEVKTAFDYLEKNGEKEIVLFGTSMGAVAIMKAIRDYSLAPSSIIVECPFGTMLHTAEARFKLLDVPSFPMAGLLVFWGGVQNNFNAFRHNPSEYAKAITCPNVLPHRRSSGLVTEILQSKTKLQRNRNHQPSDIPKLRLCAVTSWRFHV